MSFHRKTDSEIAAEICVIGGGPAGATIAYRLAVLGHNVCLIEKSDNSQRKIGESLSPGILPLLDAIGLRNRIEEAAFFRPNKIIVRWQDKSDFVKYSGSQPGFLVNRGRFDQILLTAVKEAGVEVIQPAQALRPVFDGMEYWTIPVRSDSGLQKIKAKYLIEATGKRSFSGAGRKRYSVPTIALYAYWQNPNIEKFSTFIEAGREEWFWGAHLPNGSFGAMAFIDPKRRWNEKNLKSLYRKILAKSSLLRNCLDAKLLSNVRGFDASSYIDEEPISKHLLKIGETCFSIDPLSSQGVQAAIKSGLQGSVVVHTLLSKPENFAEAIEFHQNSQKETVARHRKFTAQFYSEAYSHGESSFWRERTDLKINSFSQVPNLKPELGNDTYLKRSDLSVFVETPCIAEDYIVKKRAITHPNIEHPVAYVNNIEIAFLLDLISPGATVEEIKKKWIPYLSSYESSKIIKWLYSAGILVL